MPTDSLELSRTVAVEQLLQGLLRISRSLRARAGDWAHAVPDLSRGDVILLGVIERGERTRPGHLAAQLLVDPSVVSRQLAVLERLGLIERFPDPQDGRAELIAATASGLERLAQARAAMSQVLADRLTEWDVASIAHATTTVEAVAALLQDARDDSGAAPHPQNKEVHV
ncbi:MAG: MarR family transcriptional regulator [Marmoricola sp.]